MLGQESSRRIEELQRTLLGKLITFKCRFWVLCVCLFGPVQLCNPLDCGLEWVNLTQMTIISTTVGKNPLEEME